MEVIDLRLQSHIVPAHAEIAGFIVGFLDRPMLQFRNPMGSLAVSGERLSIDFLRYLNNLGICP